MDEAEHARSAKRIIGQILVGFLAHHEDYEGVEVMTEGRHLSAEQLRAGVESLGKPLIATPESEWSKVVVTERRDTDPVSFDFVAPLWTADGPSGLGLAIHMIPTHDRTFDFEIDGLVPIR